MPGDLNFNYSHANVGDMSEVSEAFEKTLRNHVAKGPFEVPDISIMQYGVHFYSLEGRVTERAVDAVARALDEMGVQADVRHIHEPGGWDSLQVRFGSPDAPQDMFDVADGLKNRSVALERAREILYFDFDYDMEWQLFFETEEQLYEKA